MTENHQKQKWVTKMNHNRFKRMLLKNNIGESTPDCLTSKRKHNKLLIPVLFSSFLLNPINSFAAPLEITGIFTDFNDFTQSAQGALNDGNGGRDAPADSAHNLLAYTVGGTTFSTGVDDAKLIAEGVTFTPGLYNALEPALTLAPNAGQGANDDGDVDNFLGQLYPTPLISTGPNRYDVSSYLTDGVRGLGMSTFANNVGGEFVFDLTNIMPAELGDSVPDFMYFNMAAASGNAITFRFLDATGNQVGNVVSEIENNNNDLAVVVNDRFSGNGNASNSQTESTQRVQGFTVELSDFGITQAQLGSDVVTLIVNLPDSADPPFIAYNSEAFTAVDPLSLVVEITEDANNDGFISSSELSGDIDVEVAIPSGAEAGDIITVSDGVNPAVTFVLTPGDIANGVVTTNFPAPADGTNIGVSAVLTDPTGTTLSAASDSAILDTTPPTITVNAGDNTNDTTPTISGTSDEIGATVTLTVTDSAGDDQTLTAVVQPDGTYTVDVPDATPLAPGDYTVTGTVGDAAGNTTNANEPTLTVVAPDNTNDNTPTISGTSDAIGETVTLTVVDNAGTSQTLTAVVQPDGTYSVDIPAATPLADGPYTVGATVTNSDGNTANTSDPGSVDTVAPTLTVDAGDNTNDTTPTISGTSDEIGATVTLTVTDSAGDEQTLTAVVQPDGTYTVDVPDATPLAPGDYTVTGTVGDVAGNTSNANEPTLTVDAPDLTNDNTPTITGTSDAIGETVTLTIVDNAGVSQTLTAIVQPDGTYSVDVPAATPLADGPYTVDAAVTNSDGNTANTSDPSVIDTIPPTLTVTTDASSSDTTPTIMGTSDEIGAVVTIVVTDVNGNEQELTAIVQPDGTFMVDVETPLPLGPFTVTASTLDLAGNTNSSAAAPANIIAIPTLSEWGLILLMMLLGFLGYRQSIVKQR